MLYVPSKHSKASKASIRKALAKAGFRPGQLRDEEGRWVDEESGLGAAPGIMSVSGGGVGGGGGGTAPFGRDPEGRAYGSMEERFSAAGGMRSTVRATVAEEELAGKPSVAPSEKPKNRAEANKQFWNSLGGRRQGEIIALREESDEGYEGRYKNMSEASREQSMSHWYAERHLPFSAAADKEGTTEWLDRRKLRGFQAQAFAHAKQAEFQEQRAAVVTQAEQIEQEVRNAFKEPVTGIRATLSNVAQRAAAAARHAIDIASAFVDENNENAASRSVIMAGTMMTVATALGVAAHSRDPKTLIRQGREALGALRTARTTAPKLRKDVKSEVRRLKRKLPGVQRKVDRAVARLRERTGPAASFASRFAAQAASRARESLRPAETAAYRAAFRATGGRFVGAGTLPYSRETVRERMLGRRGRLRLR